MKTFSVELPEALPEKLDSTAARKGESRSALIREAIDIIIKENNKSQSGSCLDLARDLAGSLDGPEDLSFNKDRMEGYGK